MSKKIWLIMIILLPILTVSGCGKWGQNSGQKEEMQKWLSSAKLSGNESAEELYQAALEEDTLVIYSVSSRVFEVKESFEQQYQGLTVEVKDIRGEDVVNMLQDNYEKENYACDLVICSDCNGRLNRELLEPSILYSGTMSRKSTS